jgi:hypothetical protein
MALPKNTLFDTRLGDVQIISSQSQQDAGVQFGGGTATFSGEGNINVQSNAGTFVGGSGADVVMASAILPAGTFDVAGRGVEITAMGSFLANGNTKTVKLIFNPSTAVVAGTVGGGGVTIATTGAITTGGSGWCLTAMVFKYGILGSNTQLALHQQAQIGSSVSPLLTPQATTAIEANPILIALTGNAVTLITDITWNSFIVNAMN